MLIAAACGSTVPPSPPLVDPAVATPADDLRDAWVLDHIAGTTAGAADRRLTWLTAAAAWDKVVIDHALPTAKLRGAAWRAVLAIRLARPPDEDPARGGQMTARAARELAAIDRYVALLDEPDGADGLAAQLQAAQLVAAWGDPAGAAQRLARIVGARRDLDTTPAAVDLLLASLERIHDATGARTWIASLTGDAAYAARFPDSVARVRGFAARLDYEDAHALLDAGDFTGCAAAFERAAAALPSVEADVARLDQAICLERAGRRDDAIAVYRALAARPSSRQAAAAAKRLAELGAPR